MDKDNRIWLELDKPKDFEHAKQQCELANKMLARLGISKHNKFWAQGGFFTGERHAHCPYAFTTSSAGTYKELSDNGEWFSLDYLGRDGVQCEEALKAADKLFKEALPKFDWGASALDANAIQLLNEVPQQVAKALKEMEGDK